MKDPKRVVRQYAEKMRYVYRSIVPFRPAERRLKLGSGRGMYFLTAVLRAKNEGRFLPEWIAHYHLLGCEHFYIYNNNSTDDTIRILEPFTNKGLVTMIEWPTVPSAPSCYQHSFAEYGKASRWVAFFDADEFVVEREAGLLLSTLRDKAKWPALAVNFRYFGSAFHETIPAGLVIENFLWANRSRDVHVKVIARPEAVAAYYNSHNFVYRKLGVARTRSGKVVLGARSDPTEESGLILNHYVYRSRQNYVEKLGIGYVDAEGFKHRARRSESTDPEFNRHNEVEDTTARDMYASEITKYLGSIGFGSPYVKV
jgi:hypothetical protein